MILTRPLGLLPALVLAITTAVGCASESAPSEPEDVVLPAQEKVTAPPSAGEQPGATGAASETTEAPGEATLEQYKLPDWQREDVQPKSGRAGQRYGLEAYAGRTIVVVLLEGYCPYCQSNSVVAQQLQDELAAEQLDAQIVVLGDGNASQFASRVSLPIFRDHDGAAWDAMRSNAKKHDTFVFGPDGKRTYFWLGSYTGDPARWRVEIGAAVRAVAKKR